MYLPVPIAAEYTHLSWQVCMTAQALMAAW
jgi:hypothetical protein